MSGFSQSMITVQNEICDAQNSITGFNLNFNQTQALVQSMVDQSTAQMQRLQNESVIIESAVNNATAQVTQFKGNRCCSEVTAANRAAWRFEPSQKTIDAANSTIIELSDLSRSSVVQYNQSSRLLSAQLNMSLASVSEVSDDFQGRVIPSFVATMQSINATTRLNSLQDTEVELQKDLSALQQFRRTFTGGQENGTLTLPIGNATHFLPWSGTIDYRPGFHGNWFMRVGQLVYNSFELCATISGALPPLPPAWPCYSSAYGQVVQARFNGVHLNGGDFVWVCDGGIRPPRSSPRISD